MLKNIAFCDFQLHDKLPPLQHIALKQAKKKNSLLPSSETKLEIINFEIVSLCCLLTELLLLVVFVKNTTIKCSDTNWKLATL